MAITICKLENLQPLTERILCVFYFFFQGGNAHQTTLPKLASDEVIRYAHLPQFPLED